MQINKIIIPLYGDVNIHFNDNEVLSFAGPSKRTNDDLLEYVKKEVEMDDFICNKFNLPEKTHIMKSNEDLLSALISYL